MELLIPVHSGTKHPVYEQIYEYIRNEIRSGKITKGERIPSTRVLSGTMNISRSTVQMAYDQLEAEGYITVIPCKGVYAAGIDGLANIRQTEHTAFLAHDKEENKYQIDFSISGIDLFKFPYGTWKHLSRETLKDEKSEMFLSGDHQGERSLREAIAGYLFSARGVNCSAGQIIIGAGSEYLLMLLKQILGDHKRIAMEEYTYRQAFRVFGNIGYKVCPVPMDESGMRSEILEESHSNLAYIMPSHQFPTGIVMPYKRRQEILSWAYAQEERYIIEDDYDSEFRYKGKPIPALKGMDTGEKVIYLGTFSRSIAPAIRISFLVLPEKLLEIYKENVSFYASTVSRTEQNILYQFIVQDYFSRHLNRMRAVYKAKHDLLLRELAELENGFLIHGEYAGVHVLLTGKAHQTEKEMVESAASCGVHIRGLSEYAIGEKKESSTVLLGFSEISTEKIVEGVSLLKTAWKECGIWEN